ncbi:MAG: hypothetical protein PHD83_05615, partial [Caldisericia bacterium]|nr:hypothetical protein [Caldisericia bacterium]
MLTREQLIQRWKSWMNRHRSFSKPEMEELESHLWVEMDEMVATEGCTEEEAFTKSVVNIGSADHVYPEFEKNQPFSIRTRNLIISKSIPIIMTLLLIIAFLIGDSLFSQYHTIEVYKPITGPEIVNLYNVKTKPPKIISNYLSQTKVDLKKPFDKLFFFNINESNSSVYYKRFFWFTKDNSSKDSYPCYAGKTSSLLFVIDNKNKLWIDEDEDVDHNSIIIDDIQPRKVREIKGTTNANRIYSSITRIGFIKGKDNNTEAYVYRIDDEFIVNASQTLFDPSFMSLIEIQITEDR